MTEEGIGFSGFKTFVSDLSDLPGEMGGDAKAVDPAFTTVARVGITWLQVFWSVAAMAAAFAAGWFGFRATVPLLSPHTVMTETLSLAPPLVWCFEETIRIDGARTAAGGSAEAATRLKALINDYDARCPPSLVARDRDGTIRASVESRRPALAAEGARLLFLSNALRP